MAMPDFDALPESLRDTPRTRWAALCERAESVPQLPDSLLTELPRVFACSDFVATTCERHPDLLVDLAAGDLHAKYSLDAYQARLAARLASVENETGLLRELRRFRRREMVRIVWRDIAGHAQLMDTTRDLSHLAEVCIEGALEKLYAWQCERYGTPRHADGSPMNLVVLGMGKLGAWELNVSSDIDLIFAFVEEGEVSHGGKTLTHGEFFTRLARSLINALDRQTEDGFVFRVDMRLRPFGDSGALVSSFAAMENYYQIHGREWERYALIKARVVAGDRPAGEQLMALLRPFVYRRYIDFGAFESLREMKALISREVKRKGLAHNVKLGAGGIREIEFIGQVFQLIRGGRDAKLTARKILKVLDYLGRAGYLPDYVVEELIAAYKFLRTTEHRLQEYQDRQTHLLPEDDTGRLRLAFGMDFPDWPAFEAELDRHRRRVQHHFEQVFEAPQTEGETTDDLASLWLGALEEGEAVALLERTGYRQAADLYRRLTELRQSRLYHNLSTPGRARLDRLMPLLLGAAAQAEDPDLAVTRLLELVVHIARRSVYLALLVENPLALSQLVRLCAASAWIAGHVQKYPLLLDELLDPRTLYAPPDRPELAAELARRLAGIDPADEEARLDALRQFKHVNVLRVAAADIVGALPLMKVSDHLTWIAEVVLAEALEMAWAHLAGRHGTPPGEDKGFAVIGYGKLGGYELGYGSDLDLVFLHGGEDPNVETTGPAPLALPVFYARLGQRLIHVLTAYTSAGLLYEVDMRLRPDGASGMLVSSLSAFRAYQEDKAWLWEHQALVRARPVAGDPAIREGFEAIRREILGRPRDPAEVRREIRDMRQRMRKALDKSDARHFDLKQGAGGMVDIEFLVQYGVLAHAHAHPELLEWTDNVRLLENLGKTGVFAPEEAERLAAAYRALRDAAHELALQEEPALVPADRFAEERQTVTAIWRRIMEGDGNATPEV